jgi:hypothetical protein
MIMQNTSFTMNNPLNVLKFQFIFWQPKNALNLMYMDTLD